MTDLKQLKNYYEIESQVEELKSNFKHVDDECIRLEKQVEELTREVEELRGYRQNLCSANKSLGFVIEQLEERNEALEDELLFGEVNNARS